MGTPKMELRSPSEISAWRAGFLVLTVFIVALYLGASMLFEFARQAALRADLTYLTIHIVNSYLPLIGATTALGIWWTIYIIFACTHPKQQPNYGQLISLSFALAWLVGTSWLSYSSLMANLDYGQTPPVFPVSVASGQLISNIMIDLGLGIMVGLYGLLIWYRLLRPVSTSKTPRDQPGTRGTNPH